MANYVKQGKGKKVAFDFTEVAKAFEKEVGRPLDTVKIFEEMTLIFPGAMVVFSSYVASFGWLTSFKNGVMNSGIDALLELFPGLEVSFK